MTFPYFREMRDQSNAMDERHAPDAAKAVDVAASDATVMQGKP